MKSKPQKAFDANWTKSIHENPYTPDIGETGKKLFTLHRSRRRQGQKAGVILKHMGF